MRRWRNYWRIFALIFANLFSILGMKIITITFMVIGVCMFTGFSIGEFVHDRVELAKLGMHHGDKKHKGIEDDDEDESRGSLLRYREKVIISNGNEEPEEPDKHIIKNIDELKEGSEKRTTTRGNRFKDKHNLFQ